MHIKRITIYVFFLVLVILSLYSSIDKPATTGIPSYRLTTQKTETGNTTRVDYIDESGNITFATDKHYATIIRIYEDGYVILEQYFDAEGNPAYQTLGYCALARHFNSDGLVDVIQYLDEQGEPVTTTSGYNNTHRTYTDDLSDTDTYYIDDAQVRNNYGFYSLHRSYDENRRIKEITYYDENGELTLHKNGYAKIARTYNDAGRVAYEYYFDVSGNPVFISSGYYGLYREYDEFGNAILITYLDADGQPMNGSRGFATVTRTYAYDGSMASAKYFDAAGEPVTIGRGQYGVEYVNGKGVYLDEDGEPMFRIDNFLNTHPHVVLFTGVLLTAVAMLLNGKGKYVFLIAYVLFIIIMTIWYREPGVSRGQFQFLWSYRQFFTSDMIRQEIINNIWLFVPLGALLYSPSHPHSWLWAVGLSAVIEAIQYFAGIGLCEIDDVISNGLGTMLGYGLLEAIFQFQRVKQ